MADFSSENQALQGKAIRVRGVVQGVGFRPMVWRLAQHYQLTGFVRNDSEGVMIQAWGGADALTEFEHRLTLEKPPLAMIDSIESNSIDPESVSGKIPQDFQILTSRDGVSKTAVAADAATCKECLAEVMDNANRRYSYPFSNCTHCGPRFSIIREIPFDRSNTSMTDFTMCADCQAEYDNPANRRFHAQANACEICGPKIWLEDAQGVFLDNLPAVDVLNIAARLIREGHILAIKGIGGFHLACDAVNEQTVARLRQRKQRYHKPFALMARNIDMIRQYAEVGAVEEAALATKMAPIVILKTTTNRTVAYQVAPDENKLGFMLPYTALHHCLLKDIDQPIVLTSGNRSDEPQCIDNQVARDRLKDLCDFWLMHDREIVNRVDDSVIRVMGSKPRMLRRARGYEPEALALPEGFEQTAQILAMGGELKNTFCQLRNGKAILSQHMGDLKNAGAYKDFRHNLTLYKKLFDFQPEGIAVDLHPDYLSSQVGKKIALNDDIQLFEVQHHHAHITACMAEHGLALNSAPVLGVAFDGLGFGSDGSLWGGEFLLCDYTDFSRLATFQPMPLLGGIQATLEPWRNTYAQLAAYFDWDYLNQQFSDLSIIRFLNNQPLDTLNVMMEKRINTPFSSSCGRLIDAFAAAIGICRDRVSYEGQAAIGLETLAAALFKQEQQCAYPFQFDDTVEPERFQHKESANISVVAVPEEPVKQSAQKNARVDNKAQLLNWAPFWDALLFDLQKGTDTAVIAARIHQGLAQATAKVVVTLCQQTNAETVVLNGGVFQNRLLLEEISELLVREELRVLSPVVVPCNDGGLALGQAVIAAAKAS